MENLEMDTSKIQSSVTGDGRNKESHVADAAGELLNEGKKLVNELYADGVKKVCGAEDIVKEYSDELLVKVKENPLTSVLIAAGVGFLISSFLKK